MVIEQPIVQVIAEEEERKKNISGMSFADGGSWRKREREKQEKREAD